MNTDHVGVLRGSYIGEHGWGFGFEIRQRVRGDIGTRATFGWAGGSGAEWWVDPLEGLVAVLLAPSRPPAHWEVFDRFERLMYAAVVESRQPPPALQAGD